MKTKSNFFTKTILTVIMTTSFGLLSAQNIYDVNFQKLVFSTNSGRIEHKEGGNSLTNSGSTTIKVYRNVVTIGGQAIDAVIKIGQYNNVTDFSTFDQSTTSGTGFSNNSDDFFSPFLEFGNGGGNVIFNINFIVGGSYSNTTKNGVPVILQNVYANTYDIDGNGGSGSNQFNEFGGFYTSEIANSSNIVVTYNQNTNLTRFRSNTNSNSSSIQDGAHRIRVRYSYISSFQINVGAEASGLAYFFLDFSAGPNFTNPVVSLAPNIDLNTSTAGINNDVNMACKDTVNFTFGNTNITHSATNPSIDEIVLEYDRSNFNDNGTDQILIKQSNSHRTIPLRFTNNQSFSSITINNIQSNITATVNGNISRLSFRRPSNATYSLAQAEALIDQIKYTKNCNDGDYESFSITASVRSTSFLSPPASFNVIFNIPLPLNFVSFENKIENESVLLNWIVKEVSNQLVTYEIYRSDDGIDFNLISSIESKNIDGLNFYQYKDQLPTQGKAIYKIKAIDQNSNAQVYSNLTVVNTLNNTNKITLFPNPVKDIVNVVNNNGTQIVSINISDINGRIVETVNTQNLSNIESINLNLSQLNKGLYFISFIDENNQTTNIKFQKL